MTDINLQEKSQIFFDEVKAERAKQFFQQYNRLMAYYRCAMMEIETKFNVLNEEFSLQYDRNPINDIKIEEIYPLRFFSGKSVKTKASALRTER